MRSWVLTLLVAGVGAAWVPRASAEERGARVLPDDLAFTQTADVVYGRKHGMALTMDVYTPKAGANGIGIVLVVSGGWVSDY